MLPSLFGDSRNPQGIYCSSVLMADFHRMQFLLLLSTLLGFHQWDPHSAVGIPAWGQLFLTEPRANWEAIKLESVTLRVQLTENLTAGSRSDVPGPP